MGTIYKIVGKLAITIVDNYDVYLDCEGSRILTFGVCKMTPNALKMSYSSFSSISVSRFPMKIFAPTSRFFVLDAAYRRKK